MELETPAPDGSSGDARAGLIAPLLVIALCLASASPSLTSYYMGDDIDHLRMAAHVARRGGVWSWAFQPHNEHVSPLAKLPFYVSWRLCGIHATPALLFYLAQFLGVLLLLWALSRRWFSHLCSRCFFVALFGTSAIYWECLVWMSAASFMTALLFMLLALLGVDWFREGRRKAGALAILLGAALAPMGSLVGLPAGGWAILYAFFNPRGKRSRRHSSWLVPAAAAMMGMALYLALFLHFGGNILTKGLGGRTFFGQMDIPAGARMALDAIALRQSAIVFNPLGTSYLSKENHRRIAFADRFTPGLRWIFPAVALACLAGFRRRYSGRLLAAFLLWMFVNLWLVLALRSWAPDSLLWSRYELVGAVGMAGMLALGLEGLIDATRAAASRWRLPACAILVACGVLLVLNAAWTAATVWLGSQQALFVKQFCHEWSGFPEAWWKATGEDPIRIPDFVVDVYHPPPRSLSQYAAFCWPEGRAWRVEWRPATEGLSDRMRLWLKDAPDFPGVRHFLRRQVLPERDWDAEESMGKPSTAPP